MPTINRERVRQYAYTEGASDYAGRQADVDAGVEAPSWAWPVDGADEAYVNAVGTDAICRALGLPPSAWDQIASDWCEAFCRGYRAERALQQRRHGR